MIEKNKIPEHWQEHSLEEIADIKPGKKAVTQKDLEQVGGTVPLILSGDLENTKDITVKTYTTKKRIRDEQLDPDKEVLVEERVMLAMARKGTAGRVGIFKEEAIHNKGAAAIIPRVRENVDINFLFYYFRCKQTTVAKRVEQDSKTSITVEDLNRLRVPMPPTVEEQKQIAERLDTALGIVQQERDLIENTKQLAESAFRGALRDAFSPRRIANWPAEQKLGDLVDLIQEPVVPQLTQHADYLYIDGINIVPERGELKAICTWQEQQKPDDKQKNLLTNAQNVVLYVRSSPEKRRGTLLHIDKALCSTNIAPLRVREQYRDRLSPAFLLWSLLSSPFTQFAANNKSGKKASTLTENKLLSYKLPLPDMNMQCSLIEHLGRIQEATREMQKKTDESLGLLRQVERAILQRAFQGEL